MDGTNLLCGSVNNLTKALAAAKKIRDKSGTNLGQRKLLEHKDSLLSLDELEQHKAKCMIKNVNAGELT